jgi:ABC-type phosphate transport system permease subunit
LVTGIALLQTLNLAGVNAFHGFPALVIRLPFIVRTTAITLRAIPPMSRAGCLQAWRPKVSTLLPPEAEAA